MSSLTDRARAAIVRGEAFLAPRQQMNGLWTDYELEPGESDAWITACAGWALAQPPVQRQHREAICRAADALHRLRRDTGWGYNSRTVTDGDSTAWAWRLLALVDDYRTGTPAADLIRYLTDRGQAFTFCDTETEQFGSWAQAHADVTPVVGLALLETGAAPAQVRHVRQAVLDGRDSSGLWRSFWWQTDGYAMARSLEFLAQCGGIPDDVATAAAGWLEAHPPGCAAFEAAQLLSVAATLGLAEQGAVRCAALLRMQEADGGWPPSPALLVPAQRSGGGAPRQGHPDRQRVMSTLISLHGLKQWLRQAA